MGYNTSLIILNDALDQIKDDKEFGAKVAEAALLVQRGKPVDIRSGFHCNAASVIETHHADHLTLIAVGGNTAQNLGRVGGYRASPEEILKNLAEQLGYRVIKKKDTK